MKKGRIFPVISRSFYYWFSALIILFLLIIRFILLDIDPPFFLAKITQSLYTDPYHLTFFARNKVLFNDWNPFDYHRWDIFKYSVVSGMSYILFSFFGVSRITANLAGIFLNLGGMLLFVLGFLKYRTKREFIFLAILLLLNSVLLFHSRLPLLENGLILFCGLTFYVFMKYYNSKVGQFSVGFIIAVGALTGKLFGFIMLGPVVLTYLYIYRSKFIFPVILTIGGSLSGVFIYVLLFYSGSITTMLNYYQEQAIGMYGTPLGFTSPVAFVAQFLSFGKDNGFFNLSIFTSILTFIGLALFALTIKPLKSFDKKLLPVFFCVAWLVTGLSGLMPFNYRPLRYSVFLFFPISAICAYAINLALEKKTVFSLRGKMILLWVVFLALWYITGYALISVYDSNNQALLFLSSLPALIITAVLYISLKEKQRSMGRMAIVAIVIPLVLAVVIKQGLLIYRGLSLPGRHLKAYNREISELVSPSAVLTGPYMPAFTIDNNLKGIIYLFGLSNVEKNLFDNFPITHVVSDNINIQKGIGDFPILKSKTVIRQLPLLDGTVELSRLQDRPIAYTDYERAIMAILKGQVDSLLYYCDKFNRQYPDNLTGKFGLVLSLGMNGELDKAQRLVQKIVYENPDDFRVHLFCKDFYNELFLTTKDAQYSRLSVYYNQRAKELNPRLK
jgi:4-amino-4-deoxy-L-arabinose transferase-like glycosyltransferase